MRRSIKNITIRNENNNKGLFWIDYEKFVTYFSYISFCHTNLDLYEKVLTDSFYDRKYCTQDLKVYKLIVDEPNTDFHFKLFHLNDCNSIDLGLCIFECINDDNSEKFKIQENYRKNNEGCLRIKNLMLQKKTYILVPYSLDVWNNKVITDVKYNFVIQSTQILAKKIEVKWLNSRFCQSLKDKIEI